MNNEIVRIMLECRYLISLNKNYHDLARIMNVSEKIIIDDLENKLFLLDKKLYYKTQDILKNINN